MEHVILFLLFALLISCLFGFAFVITRYKESNLINLNAGKATRNEDFKKLDLPAGVSSIVDRRENEPDRRKQCSACAEKDKVIDSYRDASHELDQVMQRQKYMDAEIELDKYDARIINKLD